MRREKSIILFLILLALLIILVWVGIYYVQYRNGRSQLQEERYHNLLYLDLLNRAIVNNIFSTEKIEDLFYDKLTETVALTVSLDDLTSEQLQKYAQILKLDEISIVDKRNRILTSSQGREEFEYELDLLGLENNESVVLSLPSPDQPERTEMVYIKKIADLYYLASIKESAINQFINDISLNSLIDFATASYHESRDGSAEDIQIKYIVIQDTLGILAATDNVRTISKIGNDNLLLEVIKQQKSRSRFIDFKGQKINETILPFELDDYNFGVIRMGTHLARLQKAETRRKIVLLMFSLIFICFLFLEYLVYRYFRKYKTSVQDLNQVLRFKEIATLGGEVAHEIKNPLNALNMIFQRLRSEFKVTSEEDKYNEMLEISSTELNRLDNIIEKFLSYSKLEVINRQNVLICDLFNEVVFLFKEIALAEGVKISTYCSSDLELGLDPEKIKQVLVNLVKNSLEAMDLTSSEPEIELIALQEKKKLLIKIRDNGKGITEEQIDKVWDIYYTTKKNGSGIGLSFSRKIIEAHGGNMRIDSRNKGTEVIIELPEMGTDG